MHTTKHGKNSTFLCSIEAVQARKIDTSGIVSDDVPFLTIFSCVWNKCTIFGCSVTHERHELTVVNAIKRVCQKL